MDKLCSLKTKKLLLLLLLLLLFKLLRPFLNLQNPSIALILIPLAYDWSYCFMIKAAGKHSFLISTTLYASFQTSAISQMIVSHFSWFSKKSNNVFWCFSPPALPTPSVNSFIIWMKAIFDPSCLQQKIFFHDKSCWKTFFFFSISTAF